MCLRIPDIFLQAPSRCILFLTFAPPKPTRALERTGTWVLPQQAGAGLQLEPGCSVPDRPRQPHPDRRVLPDLSLDIFHMHVSLPRFYPHEQDAGIHGSPSAALLSVCPAPKRQGEGDAMLFISELGVRQQRRDEPGLPGTVCRPQWSAEEGRLPPSGQLPEGTASPSTRRPRLIAPSQHSGATPLLPRVPQGGAPDPAHSQGCLESSGEAQNPLPTHARRAEPRQARL